MTVLPIYLGGIEINRNMYLQGPESQPLISVEKTRTIDGGLIIKPKQLIGGREFRLGTQNSSGATQGIWCWSTIEQIKVLEAAGQFVTLDYRGTIYTVMVIDTSNMVPFHHFEPEGPYKKYIGSVNLLEA